MKFITNALSLDSLFLKKVRTDEDQFSNVYTQHHKLVRSVIYQISGESHLNDLVQESFIKIWKHINQFKHESHLSSWIYRISVNVALDHLRTHKRKSEVYSHNFDTIIDEKTNIEKTLSDKDLVERALSQLSDEHRIVIILYFIHDLKISEIADIVEANEGTIKSRIHYAKEHLKQFLSELSQNDSQKHGG
ncbi:MAG: RNA polymerase sigma factor [Pseudobdellovibrio sp.]